MQSSSDISRYITMGIAYSIALLISFLLLWAIGFKLMERKKKKK